MKHTRRRSREQFSKEATLLAALDEGLNSPRAKPGTWKRVRAAVKQQPLRPERVTPE